MIILRLLLLLTNLHLKLLSTQGTGADKLLSTQRVNEFLITFDIRNITQCAYSFNGTPVIKLQPIVSSILGHVFSIRLYSFMFALLRVLKVV